MAELSREMWEAGAITTPETAVTAGNSSYTTFYASALTFAPTLVQQGKSARLLMSASAASAEKATASTTTLYWRGYLRVVTLPPSASAWIARMDGAGARRTVIRLGADGRLSIASATVQVAIAPTALAIGSVYRLEWDVVGSVQTLRCYLGESLTPDWTISGATPNLAIDAHALGSRRLETVEVLWDAVVTRDDATPGRETPISPPTGLAVAVWDGASEITATVTVWDGAAEVPIGAVEVSP